ncbi:hypothetical protein V7128_01475 [Neobacillus vireti]|uniref:hypothetical protein n=1 Tax=Neobacillus vireti TaxID=220686 RepID=UPI002FFE22BF
MKKNTFKKQQVETQIIWKNIPNDAGFNPYRKYYAFIQIDGSEVVFDYVGKFRTEALIHFEEQARINQGKLVSGVHAYK